MKRIENWKSQFWFFFYLRSKVKVNTVVKGFQKCGKIHETHKKLTITISKFSNSFHKNLNILEWYLIFSIFSISLKLFVCVSKLLSDHYADLLHVWRIDASDHQGWPKTCFFIIGQRSRSPERSKLSIIRRVWEILWNA